MYHVHTYYVSHLLTVYNLTLVSKLELITTKIKYTVTSIEAGHKTTKRELWKDWDVVIDFSTMTLRNALCNPNYISHLLFFQLETENLDYFPSKTLNRTESLYIYNLCILRLNLLLYMNRKLQSEIAAERTSHSF